MALESFSITPRPSLLHLIGSIVRLNLQTELRDQVGDCFKTILDTVAARIKPNLSAQPDLTAAFFDMVAKCFRTSAVLFLREPGIYEELFQWAIAGVTVNEPLTVRKACLLGAVLVDNANKHHELKSMMLNHAEHLINTVLTAISGGHLRSLVPELADVLFEFYKSNQGKFKQHITAKLSDPAFPASSRGVSHETKQRLLKGLESASMFL